MIGQVDGSGSTVPYPVALALGGGVALYLAGDMAFRRALRIGSQRTRAMAAALSLAVTAVGVTLSAAGEIALLTVIVAAALATESPGGSGGSSSRASTVES